LRMNRISTLFYILDNRDKENGWIISAEDLNNEGFLEYDDVYNLLNHLDLKPSNRVINELIAYSGK